MSEQHEQGEEQQDKNASEREQDQSAPEQQYD
jgi:hypothetical protein